MLLHCLQYYVNDDLEGIRKLNELAGKRGQTLAEMALSWLLSKERITSVLVGASKPEQILDNLKSFENITFTEEEYKLIDEYSSLVE